MESEIITTPFGRRPLSLGMLASQLNARDIAPGKSIDKWKLFRAVCEARPYLGVSDRALAVLNALLSFYPKSDLAEAHGLVVFPSNVQLSIRAHGIAPATLRRHLAALVDAGLLIRKDSPNGKRYARKDGEGQVAQAFGFSLAPLLARAEEIEAHAAQVAADRQHLRAVKERVSLCRRDVAKLIETAVEEGIAGDWDGILQQFRRLVMQIPRVADATILAPLLEALEMLRAEIANLLEIRIKSTNTIANESQFERHIQNSKPNSTYELEPAFDKKQGDGSTAVRVAGSNLKSFPLGLVLQACPSVADYGPGGEIGNWRDLMAAAVVVRSTLGVSPSAYQEACEIMGPENAAVAMACILERAGLIGSAGGYLRDLTRRASDGAFSLGPMIMALMRTHAAPGRKTG